MGRPSEAAPAAASCRASAALSSWTRASVPTRTVSPCRTRSSRALSEFFVSDIVAVLTKAIILAEPKIPCGSPPARSSGLRGALAAGGRRDGRVYVARAGHGGQAGRPQRRVQLRRRAVRDGDGSAGVRGGLDRGVAGGGGARGAEAAERARAGPAGAAREAHPALPHERSRPALAAHGRRQGRASGDQGRAGLTASRGGGGSGRAQAVGRGWACRAGACPRVGRRLGAPPARGVGPALRNGGAAHRFTGGVAAHGSLGRSGRLGHLASSNRILVDGGRPERASNRSRIRYTRNHSSEVSGAKIERASARSSTQAPERTSVASWPAPQPV